MKLIDEKIKALGLTKGQYCEKYGYKFKDFAAKVHTLEAKLEWANNFLKPLGLHAPILPTDSAEAVRFFLTERLSEQMDDESVRFLGSETPPEVKGLVFYDEIEKTVSMYNSIEGVSVQVGKEGTARENMLLRDFAKEAEKLPLFNTSDQDDVGEELAKNVKAHVAKGKVKKGALPEWCKAGSCAQANCDQFCRAEEADSGCLLDNRNDADSLL